MEPVNSRVTETAHLSLRTLAREVRRSDNCLPDIVPESARAQLSKSAFTSAI